MNNIHGTAIVIEGNALLIRGKPGSGKSDLALKLIDRGATLIADDQVLVERSADEVYLSSPDSTRGLLEIRGLGIIHFDTIERARLALVVDIIQDFTPERLPEPSFVNIKDCKFPQLKLEAGRESLHIITEIAMSRVSGMRYSSEEFETWGL